MSEALISPSVLTWARRRRDLDAAGLARKISVNPEKVKAWESGDGLPTFRQAQRAADALYIPFGYLFLREPPAEKLPIPDLRTVGDKPPRDPSPDFLDLVNDVLTKQQWFREYREAEGADPLPFIGRYGVNDDAETIAADIRDALSIDDDMRRDTAGLDAFLRELILRCEDWGILVMRSGIVGNNTHRPLDVDEFRGFAISDDLAPLVFVNGRDAKTSQIFTLAHEMAHLWIGESGVSNPDYKLRSDEQGGDVERIANRVAAETLIPSADFLARWRDAAPIKANMRRLSRRYKVSDITALRHALNLELVAPKDYWTLYKEMALNAPPAKNNKRGGGRGTALNAISRNGRVFTRAVISSAAEGSLLLGEAARLLDVNVAGLPDISERLFGDRLSAA